MVALTRDKLIVDMIMEHFLERLHSEKDITLTISDYQSIVKSAEKHINNLEELH